MNTTATNGTTAAKVNNFENFQTVTHPIQADDLKTCKVYAYSLRRDIVTDYNEEQRADLLEITQGHETAEGIVFYSTRYKRDRLHSWQNHEAQKQRAAILGEGWQWIEGLRSGTEPGDLITCIDGTRGRVTKSDPESCCIEFETADGRRLSVAGYFRKEHTTLETASAITEAEGVKVGDKVKHNKHEEVATVTAIREAFVNRADGYRYLYTLDFGQEVFGPFHVDLNGGEFLREAFTLYEKTA